MEEKMSLNTRYAYLRQMKERYGLADRRGRARLLDEMMCVTGLSRKHLITRMNRDGPHRVPRQQQRGRAYGPEVEAVVFLAADSLGWICAERIRPVLVRTAQQLIHFGELKTTEAVLAQLTQMSLSPLRRMLTRLRPADAGWPQRVGDIRNMPSKLKSPWLSFPGASRSWDTLKSIWFIMAPLTSPGMSARSSLLMS